jgi:hypothetical protein
MDRRRGVGNRFRRHTVPYIGHHPSMSRRGCGSPEAAGQPFGQSPQGGLDGGNRMKRPTSGCSRYTTRDAVTPPVICRFQNCTFGCPFTPGLIDTAQRL